MGFQGKHSPFSLLGSRLRLSRILLIPQSALVARPGTQIPSLDQESLCGINVALVLDLLDADFHAVFGENYVLGLHFLRGALGDLEEAEVEMIAYKGRSEEHNQEDDEGE